MNGVGGFPAVAALARLRDKYWFLPGVAALAGLVAGLAMVAVDMRVGDEWLGALEGLHRSRPEGARAMLSTIAGSTITVAGVVFSITLAAVTYASGQHGPRLLTNFARDRGNQLTLGVFIGTYVYCLIVLRTIRSAGEEGGAPAFVPQVAVYGALALALASIGVLIYFFHHVTDTIHINNVIARIGRKLIRDMHEQDGATGDAALTRPMTGGPTMTIAAGRAGYIDTIDLEALAEQADTDDMAMRLHRRPGDFVMAGAPLLDICSPDALSPATLDAMRAAFVIADRRNDLQDRRFGFDELTEIAIRALSPGINDPFTAVGCIDWLSAALAACEANVPPGRGGNAETRAMVLNFGDFVAISFGRLRDHAAADAIARAAALQALARLAAAANAPENRLLLVSERVLLQHAAT